MHFPYFNNNKNPHFSISSEKCFSLTTDHMLVENIRHSSLFFPTADLLNAVISNSACAPSGLTQYKGTMSWMRGIAITRHSKWGTFAAWLPLIHTLLLWMVTPSFSPNTMCWPGHKTSVFTVTPLLSVFLGIKQDLEYTDILSVMAFLNFIQLISNKLLLSTNTKHSTFMVKIMFLKGVKVLSCSIEMCITSCSETLWNNIVV